MASNFPSQKIPIALFGGLMLATVALYLLSSTQNEFTITNIVRERLTSILKHRDLKCPDRVTGLTTGSWKTRPLTAQEQTAIEAFENTVRVRRFQLPKNMERQDKKCGNVPYPDRGWFRALCNPHGTTPCCYEGKCQARSKDQCKCSKCYDIRSRVHAEYARWEPDDDRCKVKNYTQSTACDLLQGAELMFVGDSLVRHVYTGMLLVMSGNGHDGALRQGVPKEIRDQCTGLYIFTEKMCRKHINTNATFCHSKTILPFYELYIIGLKGQFLNSVKTVLGKPKSYVFVGIGGHDSFNTGVYSQFMLPALQMVKKANASWPKFIWANTHTYGLLKSPLHPEQEFKHVKVFNDFMKDKLQQHNITIFDTVSVTAGVSSQDGTHFGFGVNVLKAQLYINLLDTFIAK